MEKISINDLEIIKKIDYGTYSDIYEVVFNNEKYAFKQFKDARIFAKGLINKYDELNNLHLNKSLIPNIFVDDEKLNGFLMKLYNNKSFDYLYSCPENHQIQKLKEAKNALLEIHSKNVIHGDIHTGNFLLRSSLLTDFDNCNIKNFHLSLELCSAEALNFLMTYKLSKDLDIYLFNYMTFSILNECDYGCVDYKICDKDYGVFTSRDSIRICKSLLLQDKIFNNDFLIDTINIDEVPKRNKKIGRG